LSLRDKKIIAQHFGFTLRALSLYRWQERALLMSIMVTGASGYIGKHLIERLKNLKSSYIAVGRTSDSSNEHYLSVDLTCPVDLQLDGVSPEVVVHLAGRVHQTTEPAETLQEHRRVNCDGTLALAQWAVSKRVRRFIYVSSIAVNGPSTHLGEPFTEMSRPTPKGGYAISKFEAEKGLWRITQQSEMELCILRPPMVYGYGAPGNFSRLLRLIKFGFPLPFGKINNRRSFIYIENLVDALVHCIYKPEAANRLFLVSDGEAISTPELVRAIAEALGTSSRLLPIPTPIVREFFRLTGKAELWEKLACSLEVDHGLIRRTLGWHPPIDALEAVKRSVKPTD